MAAARQYLRVRRVAAGDFFLRARVDLADGKTFHRGDVVAACRACRQVSKRIHWQKAGNTCPFCGCADSLSFAGKKELTEGAYPPVLYTVRSSFLQEYWERVLAAVILFFFINMIILIIASAGHGSAAGGFFRNPDGRFYYVNEKGVRIQEGTLEINGQTYRFEDGLLAGQASFRFKNRQQITGEDGRVHPGWSIYNGELFFQEEEGVAANVVPDGSGVRFVSLEGPGSVLLDENDRPAEGWTVYQDRLYHMHEGKPDPTDSLAGSFDASGCFTPDEAGFVRTEEGSWYLDEKGLLQKGLVVDRGYVYALTGEGALQESGKTAAGDMDSVNVAEGILKPEEDVLAVCAGGSVIVEAYTGAVRTGWILYRGGLYFADGDGYLTVDEESSEPAGRFDADGRFLPSEQGRVKAGNIVCHILADGTLASGWVVEDDALCLYSETGAPMANTSVENIGVTDESGCLRPYMPGIFEIDREHYCLSRQGKLMTGWQYAGKLYHFDAATGRQSKEGVTENGVAYPLSGDGYFKPAVEGMYRLGGAEYYVMTDGSVATGWQTVDGSLFYFDEQTGQRLEKESEAGKTGWVQTEQARYYVLEDGTVARGWQLIDGAFYHFDTEDGRASSGDTAVGNRVYSFREDGRLAPETECSVVVGGTSYRSGTDGSPEGGFLCEGGRLYYYDEETAELASVLPREYEGWISAIGAYYVPEKEGVLNTGKDSYYLDGAGNVLSSWFARGGRLYYADPKTGCLHRDGKTEDGTFAGGAFTPKQDGIFSPDGREYCFAGGHLVTGWVLREGSVGYSTEDFRLAAETTLTIDGTDCSFDGDGRYTPDRNRVLTASGKRVLVAEGGDLPDRDGVYFVDGRLVLALEGGMVAESAQNTEIAGDVRVVDGFIIPAAPGLVKLYGGKYLLSDDGTCKTGITLYQNKLYNFGTDGRMLTDSGGFGPDGWYVPNGQGLREIYGSSYLFTDYEGTVAVGLTVYEGTGETYFADEEGRLQKGLVRIGGDRYYFTEGAHNFFMAKNEFIADIYDEDGSYYFYAGEDGKLLTGWQEIEGILYCFDEKGHMLFDTIKDGKYINIHGEAE